MHIQSLSFQREQRSGSSTTSSNATATAAVVYFWARAAHYLLYIAGVPLGRTLAFAAPDAHADSTSGVRRTYGAIRRRAETPA